jgi:hypothetical protein
MAASASLRASDSDRDRVAERLRKAASEGRLLTEELEERLEAAFRARTYGQLDALLADLPGGRLLPAPYPRSVLAPAVKSAIALAAIAAVLLVAVLIATGVFAGWILWVLVGWFFFARRGRHACRGRVAGRPGPPLTAGRRRSFPA